MAKAVIFDKDGVIFHTSRLFFEMWKRTFTQFHKPLTEEKHFKQISGRSFQETIRKHLDPNINNIALENLNQTTSNFIIDNYVKYVKPVKGVIHFLSELQKIDMPIALATSSRRHITDFRLNMYNLQQYFRTIVTAADIKYAKPDPEIFIKAASDLNVEPADCVVFEDSFSGVVAAKKAGMKVVLVMTSHTQKEIPDVDLAVNDFTKISVKDIKMI